MLTAQSAIIYTAPYARALVVPCWKDRPCASGALAALLFMDGTLRWRGAPSANDNRGAAA
jgi:hypothetical protein